MTENPTRVGCVRQQVENEDCCVNDINEWLDIGQNSVEAVDVEMKPKESQLSSCCAQLSYASPILKRLERMPPPDSVHSRLPQMIPNLKT